MEYRINVTIFNKVNSLTFCFLTLFAAFEQAKLMFMLPDLVSSMTIAFILITILILAPICYLAGVNIFAKISATDSHAPEAVSSSGMDMARDLLGALFYVVWMVFAIPTGNKWNLKIIFIYSNIF